MRLRRGLAGFGIVLASVLASQGGARAQDVPACALVDPDAVKAWALARQASSNCPVECSGCGCKGGPGYRSRPRDDGKKPPCVSYAKLVSECGPPPHEGKGCTRECTPVVPGCRRPSKVEVENARKKLDADAAERTCASGYRYAGKKRCVGVKTAPSLCADPATGVCEPTRRPGEPPAVKPPAQ